MPDDSRQAGALDRLVIHVAKRITDYEIGDMLSGDFAKILVREILLSDYIEDKPANAHVADTRMS